MIKNPDKWSFGKTAITAALTALTAIATMSISIRIPATNGYFNIGDVFVILAGLWLGPLAGLIVGAVGPSIADAMLAPVFIPATLVTKGLEGFLVGIIGGGARCFSLSRKLIAAIAGGLTIVIGYFLFQAYIYPALGKTMPAFKVTDYAAAIVEIFPNSIQGLVGAAGGLALWKALSGYSETEESQDTESAE